jgi:predicted double-glycine peptidase
MNCREFAITPILFASLLGIGGCGHLDPGGKQVTMLAHPRHSLKQLRDQYVVKQQLDYSCGSAALATLMIYYFGHQTSEPAILKMLFEPMSEEERKEKSQRGFSLLDLKHVANRMGFQAEGFRLSADQLVQLSAPVIVYLEAEGYKHFAVYRGMSWRRVYLADPARGNLRLSRERFLEEWQGIIFALGRDGEESIKDYPLSVQQNPDYGQPELVPSGRQIDLSLFTTMLPLR